MGRVCSALPRSEIESLYHLNDRSRAAPSKRKPLSVQLLKSKEDYNLKPASSFPPHKLTHREAHTPTAVLHAAPPTEPAPLSFLKLWFLNGLSFRKGVYEHELTVSVEAALLSSPKPNCLLPFLRSFSRSAAFKRLQKCLNFQRLNVTARLYIYYF